EALRSGFCDETLDVVRHQTSRQGLGARPKRRSGIRRRQDRAAAPSGFALAVDGPGSPETMTAGDDVKHSDQARNISAVGYEHQANETVSPQHDRGEDGEASEYHPQQ